MTTIDGQAGNEAQIHKILDDRVQAVRAKDVAAASKHCAPNVRCFDVVNPLQNSGVEWVGRRAEEWFSSFDGPIGFEISEVSITTGNDVAFAHSLNHVSATNKSGQQIDMWWRATFCFRKIDGQWLIVHEHNSVPFDMETGQASLDLKP